MAIGWGEAVGAIAQIINKVLNHFSPEELKKRRRAKLDMLEARKTEILGQPPTEERARELVKIQKKIEKLRSKLKED